MPKDMTGTSEPAKSSSQPPSSLGRAYGAVKEATNSAIRGAYETDWVTVGAKGAVGASLTWFLSPVAAAAANKTLGFVWEDQNQAEMRRLKEENRELRAEKERQEALIGTMHNELEQYRDPKVQSAIAFAYRNKQHQAQEEARIRREIAEAMNESTSTSQKPNRTLSNANG